MSTTTPSRREREREREIMDTIQATVKVTTGREQDARPQVTVASMGWDVTAEFSADDRVVTLTGPRIDVDWVLSGLVARRVVGLADALSALRTAVQVEVAR